MNIVHSFDDKRPFENSVLLLKNLDQREDSTSYSLEIFSATAPMSSSRRALNGRGRPRSPTISVFLVPLTTVTTKLPFPGFSGLTVVFKFALSSSSDSFFAERPNTPHDLHASITTDLLLLDTDFSPLVSGSSGFFTFFFADIYKKLHRRKK